MCHEIQEVQEVFSQSQGKETHVTNNFIPEPYFIIAHQNSVGRKPKSQCLDDPGSICSFTSVTSIIYEDVRRSGPKRPPTLDTVSQHFCKRARQEDFCGWQVASEVSPLRAAPVEPLPSVASRNRSRCNIDCFHEEPTRSTSTSTSGLSFVSCLIGEEEHKAKSATMPKYSLPCSTVDKGQSSISFRLEDDLWSLFDYYPRKHVAVGPNHQASIPAWRPRPPQRSSKGLNCRAYLQQVLEEDNDEKFIGKCIIPMVGSTSTFPDDTVGPLSNCDCSDEGSIRCVKQHVNKARDTLERAVGPATFRELGFHDMGEYVAQNWTKEEELVFLKVVAANPASLGRNFWDHLPHVYPSRCSKELVNYYFNVFMLRKRSEQNRNDPRNIDSDDDEWQECEEGGEVPAEVYESDSAVDTPGYQHDAFHGNGTVDDEDFSEDEDEDGCDAEEDGSQKHGGIIRRGRQENCCEASFHLEEHDLQDDSCTSYEVQHIGASCAPDAAAEYGGMTRNLGGDAGIGAADSDRPASPDDQSWDARYFSVLEKNVDFLPTCRVIEEVFGGEGSSGR